MPALPPAASCPLCSQPNRCSEALRDLPDTPVPHCWCMDATIDPLLLARIPHDRRGRACICANCAVAASKIGASFNPVPRSPPCPPTTSK